MLFVWLLGLGCHTNPLREKFISLSIVLIFLSEFTDIYTYQCQCYNLLVFVKYLISLKARFFSTTNNNYPVSHFLPYILFTFLPSLSVSKIKNRISRFFYKMVFSVFAFFVVAHRDFCFCFYFFVVLCLKYAL